MSLARSGRFGLEKKVRKKKVKTRKRDKGKRGGENNGGYQVSKEGEVATFHQGVRAISVGNQHS